MIIQAISH